MSSTNAELACTYAALILTDDDIAIMGEKIQTIIKAAGVDIEPYWPGLYAKALENINVKDLITNIGSGVGAAPAGGAAPAAGAAAPAVVEPAKEEKKKESEPEESDDDMGLGLFD